MKRDLENEIITLKSYSKQDNFILFELDFDVKFPLLGLLLFLSELNNIFHVKLKIFTFHVKLMWQLDKDLTRKNIETLNLTQKVNILRLRRGK